MRLFYRLIRVVDPGFGAPSYDDWYGNDVADKLAVEGRLFVAAARIHCAEPFNPLHPNLSNVVVPSTILCS